MALIHIALGSNIDPENNIKAAVTMLRERHPAIRFSSMYRSAPLHHEEQDDFLNAVAAIETDDSLEKFFESLMHIERKLGKNPPFRFGPRTIDLDLLLHGDDVHPDEDTWKVSHQAKEETGPLIIPHPRMHERRFVLEPLTEITDPHSRHPILGKTWQEFLETTLDQEIERMRIIL